MEPGFGTWMARELTQHVAEAFANVPVEVLHGAKVVEVRPQGYDKGHALHHLADALGPFDLVLAAGDDHTDEQLFAAVPPSGFAVKVGPGPTRAAHRLRRAADLRALLRDLAAARRTHASQPKTSE